MASNRRTRRESAPAGGAAFALRAIGIVIVARWLYSMSETGFAATLQQMTLSPWACAHLIYIFLLIALPGAKLRPDRPFHSLPLWLSRALRWLAAAGFLFAVFSIGSFVALAGVHRVLASVSASNGWLVIGPALYLAVIWLCRPRARWATRMSAGQFALGRYAVSIDGPARLATIWNETRRLGQYPLADLSLSFDRAFGRTRVTLTHVAYRGAEPAVRPPHSRRIMRVLAWTAADRDSAYALQAALQAGGTVTP